MIHRLTLLCLPIYCLFIFSAVVTAEPDSWTIETVDQGCRPSGVVDDSLRVHLVYSPGGTTTDPVLGHAIRGTIGWQFSAVETVTGYGEISKTDAVLGSDGSIHGAYHVRVPYDQIRYTYFDGSGWGIGNQVDEYTAIDPMSLALGPGDIPYIAYPRMAGSMPLYMKWKPDDQWLSDIIEYGFEGDPDIAIDNDGYAHVVYCHDSGDPPLGLRYATNDGPGWVYELVDGSDVNNPDVTSSIDLDAAGMPHVAYYRNVDQSLIYAYKDESGWNHETVESSGDAGTFPSLCLDDSDNVHIAYYDFTTHDLKYAYRSQRGWSIGQIDCHGDVGARPVLALDPYDNPHIFYEDGTNGTVKHAYAGLNLTVTTDQATTVQLSWSTMTGISEFRVYGIWPFDYFEPDLIPPYSDLIGLYTGTTSPALPFPPDSSAAYRVVGIDGYGHEVGRSNLEGLLTYDLNFQ